jgi:hypothetical protein
MRTAGCGNCYTQQDIEAAKIVEELLDFPNNEPDKLIVIRSTKDDFLSLIQNVPEFAVYRKSENIEPYYFGEYVQMYVNHVLVEHVPILKFYLGENCIKDND